MDYTIFENVFKKIVCSAMLKGIVNYTCEKPVEKPDTQTNYVLVVTISIMILILLFSLYDSCSNIPKKKSVALLPILKAENMDIFLIENRHDCKVACSIITEYCRLSNVIGFDCEWVSRYDRGPVALVQLACQNGCCYLFRLNLIGHEAYELKELLENDKIIKVGVCPFNDAKYLRADYDWQVCI